MGYLRPCDARTISSWATHRRRNPPSQEAGTDIGCPMGTPLRAAAAGTVADVGGGTAPATGYFVTIDLDDGRRIRYLHLWDRYVTRGQRVSRGQIFAQSGGSGYGSMTAAAGPGTVGPHVHVTLWPTHAYRFGSGVVTLDFELYADLAGAASAGGGSTPFDAEEAELMGAREDIQAMHDVTRKFVLDQVQAMHDVTRTHIIGQGQAQHDVTRLFLMDRGQAMHDITRTYLADTVTAAVSKLYPNATLEEIRTAVADAVGTVPALSDDQVKVLGEQLTASAVAGIDAALRDDFDGVKARIAQLPEETITALKAAL